MLLFEAYLKQNGLCIRGEDWNAVPSGEVKCLVVYNPFLPGVSLTVEAIGSSAEFFLYKEALATVGGAPNLVKVVFGKKEGEETLKICFIVGGRMEVERC